MVVDPGARWRCAVLGHRWVTGTLSELGRDSHRRIFGRIDVCSRCDHRRPAIVTRER